MKKFISTIMLGVLSMSLLVGCTQESTSSVATDEAVSTEMVMMADGEKALPEVFGNFAILDFGYLDHFIHLGVAPVAAPITLEPAADATAQSLVSYLDGYGRIYSDRSVLDGIEPINASDDGIDIEQLLSLGVDYIITSEGNLEYADKLNMVAPTYFIPASLNLDENGNKEWKETHRLLAELVGAEDKAEENIEVYENILAEYQAEIGDSLQGKTAIVTQISTKGVQYSVPTSHPHVFAQLGLVAPEGFPESSGTIALENLVEYDPDYLFINVESWADFATYEASPIWQNLKAVQNGNVFEFAHFIWNRSSGSMAALTRMQDVGNFIVEGEQVTERFDY